MSASADLMAHPPRKGTFMLLPRDSNSDEGRMEQPEVHTAPILTPPHHHARAPRISDPALHSVLVVPSAQHAPKMVRRGHRARRNTAIVVGLAAVLLAGAFVYAFVVEHNREQAIERQLP